MLSTRNWTAANIAALLLVTSSAAFAQEAAPTSFKALPTTPDQSIDLGAACAKGSAKGAISTLLVALLVDFLGGGGVATTALLSGGWIPVAVTGCAAGTAAELVDKAAPQAKPTPAK